MIALFIYPIKFERSSKAIGAKLVKPIRKISTNENTVILTNRNCDLLNHLNLCQSYFRKIGATYGCDMGATWVRHVRETVKYE